MFSVQNKVEVTIRKLALWAKRVNQSNYDLFENLEDFHTKEQNQLPITLSNAVREHLQGLRTQLRAYFPIPDVQCNWIENPFASHISMPADVAYIQGAGSRREIQWKLCVLACFDIWVSVVVWN